MRKILVFSLLLLFNLGCSEKEQSGLKSVSDVEVGFTNEQDIQKFIKNREGKMLFVNVWATWCLPCIEEFPYLIQIYNEYRDKEFDFLSLSADYGENADSVVRSFLISQQAEFPVYIIEEQSSQDVINLLNEKWSGALPATFIYDSEGNQQKYILGAQSYETFKQSIDSVLRL
jgi:thiol-disulfide isomerase/thioredoxin